MKGNKFRVGIKPTNAFISSQIKGENNVNWKGNNVGYDALHDWLKREFGKPQICEFCSSKDLGSTKYQWANKSGKYIRIREDWLRLCAKCHYKYDKRDKVLQKYQKLPIKYGKPNKTGFKNVRLTRSNTYRPHIKVNGKVVYLGTYKTAEQAYKVYKSKALELYGTY